MALVRVNEQGRRIGETHRNARHSDADVERAIAAYEVLLSQGELEPVWAADTQRRLLAMGLWPKALPLQNFSTGDDFELTRKNRT